jgi:hypothetical protein
MNAATVRGPDRRWLNWVLWGLQHQQAVPRTGTVERIARLLETGTED